MGTLYVDRKDCQLTLSGNVISLHAAGRCVQHVPAALLARIVLRADTRLTSGTLAGLADQGIGVTMLGGRRGDRLAMLVGAPHSDARLRITQIRRLGDEEFNHEWCRHLLLAKCNSQRRLLQQAQGERPDLRKPLHDGLSTIADCSARLHEQTDVDTMRGLEGAAAAAHFRAFAHLFAPTLGFERRRRRPPTDPVNACLSLGYTLLHGLAVEACHAQGLDPMVGYLHRPAHGRASLACDLVEPWRVRVDALVWQLFRSGILEAAHFGTDGANACLLGKAGRSHFYSAWSEMSGPLGRALRRHARLATRSLGDMAKEFDTGDAWEAS
jgi:CRISPR-associated protein Cas1